MSRDIFVRDSWRMCRPLLTSPDGWMPSPLPFGQDVGVLRSVVLDKHRGII